MFEPIVAKYDVVKGIRFYRKKIRNDGRKKYRMPQQLSVPRSAYLKLSKSLQFERVTNLKINRKSRLSVNVMQRLSTVT